MGSTDDLSVLARPSTHDHAVVVEGGWWPPGEGEPGEDWGYEVVDLKLQLMPDEDTIDVLMPTPDGDRALCAIPVAALALLLVRERLADA